MSMVKSDPSGGLWFNRRRHSRMLQVATGAGKICPLTVEPKFREEPPRRF